MGKWRGCQLAESLKLCYRQTMTDQNKSLPKNMPLAGIRVIELARVLAGPWAGQMLADLGADVIKIEHADGDETRHWGPPFIKGADDSDLSSAYYHSTNRGKRSIVVDLTKAEGQKTVRQLAGSADVLIENFKVGGLQKYRLDTASLMALNPQLIVCSITGFGQDGPYADRAGYDFIVQGMSGFMALTGEPSGEPVKAGVAFADIFTGIHSVVAIQAAIIERARTGNGQHIDMALLDVQSAVLANQNMNYLATGNNPKRVGNAHTNIAPYAVFEVNDGHVILAVGNDSQFRKLCTLLAHKHWADDARFIDNPARLANVKVLSELITFETRKHTRAELMAACETAGVPAGPINQISDMFADPQIQHRQMRVDNLDDLGTSIPGVRTPIIMDGRKMVSGRPSPRLGEHTDAILSSLAAGEKTP
jgi:crotonobetainyl-CoA:carnitine CoA-transferase CaiB-like acyl-CoA transferase